METEAPVVVLECIQSQMNSVHILIVHPRFVVVLSTPRFPLWLFTWIFYEHFICEPYPMPVIYMPP
jgi:hypothetical protein